VLQPPDSSGDVDLVADLTAVAAEAGPASSEAPAAPAGSRPSLWRHADYVKIWSAATISLMGSQITLLAVPFIAAVVLRAAPFEVALLGALEMLPFLLFTLPAGAWLDRVRRRPVLIAGDLGRAAVLITIPVAHVLGALTIWQLYAVAFAAGTLTVFFDVADQSYLPALLEADDLVEGNAKLQISASAAQIIGPGAGGGLVGLAGAPLAIVADAASFVASGGLIALIRRPEPKPKRNTSADGKHTSLRHDISEGLRYVLGNRYLRMIAACTGTSNLGTSLAFAIFPVFAYVELGLSPALVGLAFGLGSFGVLAGAVTSAPVARRLGVGPAIIASNMLSGPAILAVAALPSEAAVAGPLLLASQFAMGYSAVLYNVNQVSFRQAITPLELQGRMNATMRFVVWGIMPVGAVLGGLIASFIPLRATILVGGVVTAVSFLWVLFSPVRSLREIPRQARQAA
jgi:MFS family permease